jgi:hypothetical protein
MVIRGIVVVVDVVELVEGAGPEAGGAHAVSPSTRTAVAATPNVAATRRTPNRPIPIISPSSSQRPPDRREHRLHALWGTQTHKVQKFSALGNPRNFRVRRPITPQLPLGDVVMGLDLAELPIGHGKMVGKRKV